MSALTRTVHKFSTFTAKLSNLLRGARVVHTAHHGELRLKVFRAPAGLWLHHDTVVIEGIVGFGRWTPIAILNSSDLADSVRLLSDTTEWVRENLH